MDISPKQYRESILNNILIRQEISPKVFNKKSLDSFNSLPSEFKINCFKDILDKLINFNNNDSNNVNNSKNNSFDHINLNKNNSINNISINNSNNKKSINNINKSNLDNSYGSYYINSSNINYSEFGSGDYNQSSTFSETISNTYLKDNNLDKEVKSSKKQKLDGSFNEISFTGRERINNNLHILPKKSPSSKKGSFSHKESKSLNIDECDRGYEVENLNQIVINIDSNESNENSPSIELNDNNNNQNNSSHNKNDSNSDSINNKKEDFEENTINDSNDPLNLKELYEINKGSYIPSPILSENEDLPQIEECSSSPTRPAQNLPSPSQDTSKSIFISQNNSNNSNGNGNNSNGNNSNNENSSFQFSFLNNSPIKPNNNDINSHSSISDSNKKRVRALSSKLSWS